MGGTIRLGAWPCKIISKTILAGIYKKEKFPNGTGTAMK